MKFNQKIGIAGCGWIATYAHIPALYQNKLAEITAVFDININTARETATQFSIKNVYSNYNEFLNSGIDAVIICTPNYTHTYFVVSALNHGKHVLCEKPIAINTREVLKIAAAAKKNNRYCIPAFVNRFREDVLNVKSIIDRGFIGDIEKVEGSWLRQRGVPRPGTWFTNKQLSGGGVLIDLGSHVIDICFMLSNADKINGLINMTELVFDNTEEAEASWFEKDEDSNLDITVETMAKGTFILNNKIQMEIELGWNTSEKNDYTQFKIYGTKGRLELKTLFGFSTNNRWDDVEINLELKNQLPIKKYLNKEDPLNPFIHLDKYFLQTISGHGDKRLTLNDGLKVVRGIDFFYKSVEK